MEVSLAVASVVEYHIDFCLAASITPDLKWPVPPQPGRAVQRSFQRLV